MILVICEFYYKQKFNFIIKKKKKNQNF
jgi:hypothetical protein